MDSSENCFNNTLPLTQRKVFVSTSNSFYMIEYTLLIKPDAKMCINKVEIITLLLNIS